MSSDKLFLKSLIKTWVTENDSYTFRDDYVFSKQFRIKTYKVVIDRQFV